MFTFLKVSYIILIIIGLNGLSGASSVREQSYWYIDEIEKRLNIYDQIRMQSCMNHAEGTPNASLPSYITLFVDHNKLNSEKLLKNKKTLYRLLIDKNTVKAEYALVNLNIYLKECLESWDEVYYHFYGPKIEL